MLTIDFQGINEPLQQRDYLPISLLKCLTHLNTHKFDEEMKITTKTLLKSRYTSWRIKIIQCIMICKNKSSIYVECFLFLLAIVLKNELAFNLYCLSLKTNYYVFSDDNWLATFEIQLAAIMLQL